MFLSGKESIRESYQSQSQQTGMVEPLSLRVRASQGRCSLLSVSVGPLGGFSQHRGRNRENYCLVLGWGIQWDVIYGGGECICVFKM